MRRVISIFLLQWPIEACLRRSGQAAVWLDKPFVIANLEERRQSVIAVNRAARHEGITPGMPVSHARAIYPNVSVVRAQPHEDARSLHRLALWCLRFSPIVAPCPPNGIWIDATGVAHLFGGERPMLEKIAGTFKKNNITARVAMAQTPGAAWAWSHYGEGQTVLAEAPGELDALPITALRLNADAAHALWHVGIKTIAALRKLPRATIPVRFGAEVLRRLDQAVGFMPEPIDAILPPTAKQRCLAFAEPVSAPEDLRRTAQRLTNELCADLERTQEGARKLDLVFLRTDNQRQAIRIGTARPSRDSRHLFKLLAENLDTIDPGFGIEAVTLTAWRVNPLSPMQMETDGSTASETRDLGELIDRLANRVGEKNVCRFMPIASDIPERAAKRVRPMTPVTGDWPVNLPRPVRLLSPPEMVSVTALLPDHPPARFSWRGESHKVRCADGPERIFGEWWRGPREVEEIRDYFRIENERGERYWLFRESRPARSAAYSWYLHGLFA